MNEIIEFTNSEEFKIHGNLQMTSLEFNSINSIAEIQLQTELNEVLKNWKIIAENPIKINCFEAYNFLGYREIKLYQKHISLSLICDDVINCKIEGKPKNKFEFIGELGYELEKVTGNWIPLNEIISSLEFIFEEKVIPEEWRKFIENTDYEIINIPKFLYSVVHKVCLKHSLKSSKFEEMNNVFNYENKVIIFGNEIVSPRNEKYLMQPYIIAENFKLSGEK